MRLAGRPVLEAFVLRHAEARPWISAWLEEIEASSWDTSHELKDRYPSASILADRIVIFNVKGNKFRLETRVSYQNKIVQVIWAGTHAEYSKRS